MKQDSIDKNMQERVGNLFKMFMCLIWHLEKGKSPCVDRLSRWHADREVAAMSATEELFRASFQIHITCTLFSSNYIVKPAARAK